MLSSGLGYLETSVFLNSSSIHHEEKKMFRPVDFYIDLGTANTLIYAKRRGFLLNEPSVLAMKHRQSTAPEMFALGHPAKSMLGKNPDHLSILRPLREGVISDFDNTARMLHAFIKRVKENILWIRPRMIISLPCRVTRFEKQAVEEVGYALGARTVHLLDEPVAAAIGAGLPVLGNRGHMVVDIGGGTTEIAVMALGGIITSHAVRIGGDAIDKAIMDHLRHQFRFIIGEPSAERIKLAVGSATMNSELSNASIEVGGFNLVKGLPSKLRVDSSMIFPAIDGIVSEFTAAIHKALEECPPEIAGDVALNGIVLAGGGALLKGLKERVALETGVPVKVARDPLLAVALGGAKALEDTELFDGIERPA